MKSLVMLPALLAALLAAREALPSLLLDLRVPLPRDSPSASELVWSATGRELSLLPRYDNGG